MRRLCPPPGFRPEARRGIARAPFASSDHGPCGSSVTACRHHRSVREPARPTSIRVAWNRERCVSLFASHASADLAPGASLRVRRQALRRAHLHVSPLSLRAADADPSRMVRSPCWKNLNQEVPTSDVPCRISGTDHRLQPTHRCPNRSLRHPVAKASRPRTIGGFTRVASTASRPARKGKAV